MAEKNLSEIPKALREQYEKGIAAFQRDNLDYAIAIFMDLLSKEPAFYECREALRATQLKRRKPTGILQKLLKTTHPKLVRAQAIAKHNPLEAIRLCEEVLNQDPLNLIAHRTLSEAALAADLPKTAALSLEILIRHQPEHREIALMLVEAYEKTGQWNKAEALLESLLRKWPDDVELADRLKAISAEKTLYEAGYAKLGREESSYRQVLKDESEARLLEQEARQFKDKESQQALLSEYKRRLEQEPNNLRLLRAIAELHAERKEFDAALEYYRRIQQMETKDPTLEKAIAEIYARKFDQEIEQLDPSDPDYEKKKKEILQRKETFLLEDAKQRVSRYPNDPYLRFELGQRLYNAGQIREAIQQFQKAQLSPHLRTKALYYLALCFKARGIYDLAARALQNALESKTEFDAEKKELLYELGCVYEMMGRPADAIEQFKAIYEVDIEYRDVADRVDAYYSSQRSKQQPNG